MDFYNVGKLFYTVKSILSSLFLVLSHFYSKYTSLYALKNLGSKNRLFSKKHIQCLLISVNL